jgi:hypothetical protein
MPPKSNSPKFVSPKVTKCADCIVLNDKLNLVIEEMKKMEQKMEQKILKLEEAWKNQETIQETTAAKFINMNKVMSENSQVKLQSRLSKVEKVISSSDCSGKKKIDSIQEVEERKKREKNCVLYGLQESDKTDPKQRCDDDKVLITKTLKKAGIKIKEADLLSVFRAGKKQDKNRPTIIKLSCQTTKDEIIKHGFHIKTETSIRVSPDLTPMQRENLSNLYKQAEEKNKDAESKNYLWRVVGPRDLPKLVKKPKQI